VSRPTQDLRMLPHQIGYPNTRMEWGVGRREGGREGERHRRTSSSMPTSLTKATAISTLSSVGSPKSTSTIWRARISCATWKEDREGRRLGLGLDLGLGLGLGSGLGFGFSAGKGKAPRREGRREETDLLIDEVGDKLHEACSHHLVTTLVSTAEGKDDLRREGGRVGGRVGGRE